ILRKQMPVLYHGSHYADRLPIGKPEIIQNGSAARLRDFYHDWYTPDRMAVIAVGDVDPSQMQKLIQQHFGSIPANSHPRPTPRLDVPPHQETLVSVATDKEATATQVSLVYARPRERIETVREFRGYLMRELFSELLDARLSEVA